MRPDRADFFKLYFSELEKREIPYAILHSYDQFPERIATDIDYAVPARDLPKLAGLQQALAARHSWQVICTIEAKIHALYTVLVDPDDPDSFLQLDACGHYVERTWFLLPDAFL